MPSSVPSTVPATPTKAPHIRKIRMMAPEPAPIVRSTAMSRVLSLHHHDQATRSTLNAATRMISVRMRNITFRSTSTAAKKLLLFCVQSTHRSRRSPSSRAADRAVSRADVVGVGRHHSIWLTRVRRLEEHLRCVQRHEHKAGVGLVEADLEDRDDLVGARCAARLPNAVAAALRRDQRAAGCRRRRPKLCASPTPIAIASSPWKFVERCPRGCCRGPSAQRLAGPRCVMPAHHAAIAARRARSSRSTCPSTTGMTDTTPGSAVIFATSAS